MKRTVQMATGNVTLAKRDRTKRVKRKLRPVSRHTLRFQADKSPPIVVRSNASVGGFTRRAMAKRTRGGMMNFPLMAAIAGPFRSAFMSLMAFSQQQTEAHEKKREELRKRGPQ